MDARFVGIDVSKDKLDVHTRPGGEKFVVSRDAAGLDELIKRLKPLHATAIGVEATGGFEQVVTATLAGAGMPVVVVNPAQVRIGLLWTRRRYSVRHTPYSSTQELKT